jgi:uncharacterized membrane protein
VLTSPSPGDDSPASDSGQLTVLILGYTAIAALLAVVGIVASALFLDRRALAAAADDAAIAAAGSVDTAQVYSGGVRCGQPLPLDEAGAGRAAAASVVTDTDLRRGFSEVQPPVTAVTGNTVSVILVGRAAVPFGGIVGLLDPDLRDGFTIRVASDAESPAVTAGGC